MGTPGTTTPPTPTTELPPQFDFAAAEREIYERWERSGAFGASVPRSSHSGGDRQPFTIVMPPPNVTAVLHMGHGLDNTVQDVLIRWRRMAGDEALWVPGTDHAGIATQNVVERLIAGEGLTRYDVGRDAFVRRTVRFVEETGGAILGQLRALGASCDWSRTAYTLSPELSRAVREAFVRLYEKGLVYRGHRVIHWCPRCLTSLSDEEAEFHDTAGKLYHVSYPLSGEPERSIVVATTRPETMLGDVAVAVHPDDERYRDLIGRTVVLPIANIEIPIIGDTYTDPTFGSGAVKITPAHDANDFEVGQRHDLPMPVVITPTGSMDEEPPREGDHRDGPDRVPAELRGLDRFEARERIVQMLKDAGRLVKVESHDHAVRRCYRCDTVVEPRLSDQWFVKMRPLAEPALAAVRDGRIRIVPERWEGVYIHWLENIRDWNISRQLWWGHRIPVWYCDGCGRITVSRDDVATCPSCAGPVHQDEDVLDTWFSSWLWPFSTLGWPRDTPDLKAFYPTDVLVSGPDILFFWVARMIMSGFEFMGESPYHTVYLHGIARDTQHRKMSKTLGNGIDPLDVINRFGADPLRYTVVAGMGLGVDIIFDPNDLEKSFAPGRNFVTKLWNIGRFLLTNVGASPVRSLAELDPDRLTRADHWILARLDAAIADCDAALGPARPQAGHWTETERTAGLRLNDYAENARRFVWNELADWYLEAVKARLAEEGDDREVARAVLVHAFDGALRLLHPIVPFVTEALWQRLPGRADDELLIRAAWPRQRNDAGPAAAEFELVREAVSALRQLRGEYNINPGKVLAALVVPAPNARPVFAAETALIGRLAKATVSLAEAAPGGEAAAHQLLADGSEVILPLAGTIDVAKECARLQQELAGLETQLSGLRQRLANERFVSRAKPEVVEAERQKEREWSARSEQLAAKVKTLCGG
ncbi:MAG TPA: valine--tRNA ligase [Gemmatimonadaceae bacterium]|jgi:valyl-tRNA synthetase|nr:valine--tRNA ligase [Gemmatimonadaceae bacterium]